MISAHTVATHVRNIMSKMQVSSRHKAAHAWREAEIGTG